MPQEAGASYVRIGTRCRTTRHPRNTQNQNHRIELMVEYGNAQADAYVSADVVASASPTRRAEADAVSCMFVCGARGAKHESVAKLLTNPRCRTRCVGLGSAGGRHPFGEMWRRLSDRERACGYLKSEEKVKSVI